MQFPNIIELIDEYLGRLIEVRRLLADLDLPVTQRKTPIVVPTRAAKSNPKVKGELVASSVDQSSRRKLVHPTTLEPAVKEPKTESLLHAPAKVSDSVAAISVTPVTTAKPREPEVQSAEKRTIARARTRQPSKKKTAIKESPAKTGALALGGKIPTGPIVISAEQIRNEESMRLKEPASGSGPSPSPNDVPLTAELLAQRWKQGSQFSAS